jgi:hypothetical protein
MKPNPQPYALLSGRHLTLTMVGFLGAMLVSPALAQNPKRPIYRALTSNDNRR